MRIAASSKLSCLVFFVGRTVRARIHTILVPVSNCKGSVAFSLRHMAISELWWFLHGYACC